MKFNLNYLFIGIALVYSILFYIAYKNPTTFGPVGDFIAGLLNPLITLVAAYFAYKAYTKETDSYHLTKEELETYKSEIKTQREDNAHKSEIKKLEGAKKMFETFIYELEYINPAKNKVHGGEAVEAFIKRLDDVNHITSITNSQFIHSLEACNEAYNHLCNISIDSELPSNEKKFYVWYAILAYKQYFYVAYEKPYLKTTVEKAKNHLEHLRTTENHEEKFWLSEKPLTDFFDSIKSVTANYNFAVAEINRIDFSSKQNIS